MATSNAPRPPAITQPIADMRGITTVSWYTWLENLTRFLPSFPLSVASGGTGRSSLTAHSVLLGEGTNPVGSAGPGATAGVPLIAGGTSADPTFGTALVAGGGTGLVTLTAHALLVGEGVANVGLVGPGATSGIPLIAQGVGADPAFGVAVVQGGGTGTNTLPAHAALIGNGTSPPSGVAPGTSGNVLTSNGTDWTSAAVPVAAQQWNAGTVNAVGAGLIITSQTLIANWQAGSVVSLGTGLTITANVLTPNWQADVITSVGTGLTVTAGVLHT